MVVQHWVPQNGPVVVVEWWCSIAPRTTCGVVVWWSSDGSSGSDIDSGVW